MTKKSYKHIGVNPLIFYSDVVVGKFDGVDAVRPEETLVVQPGESFTVEMDAAKESFLVRIGAIQVVIEKPAAKPVEVKAEKGK